MVADGPDTEPLLDAYGPYEAYDGLGPDLEASLGGRTGYPTAGRARIFPPKGEQSEQEGTTEEKARAEYRSISERRVRLGLVMSEIGESAGVTVTESPAAIGSTMKQVLGG